jgi:hypothetical protein
MPLSYLLDENVPGRLDRAIGRHNAQGTYLLDVVRVGEPADLPPGSGDPEVLVWAELQGRILVSLDENTLPRHLADHLGVGRHSPGVFLIRPQFTIPQVIAFLALAAYAADPAEYVDRIEYVP